MKSLKFRSIGALIMLLAASPATWALTHTQKDTVVGAGTGAVAGAVVAGPVGAAVGAGVGGVVGHKVGERHRGYSQRVKTAHVRR